LSFYLIEKVPLVSVLPMREVMDIIDRTFKQQGQGNAVNIPRRRMHLPNGLILGMLPGAAPQFNSVGVELYCDGEPVTDNRDERETLVIYDSSTGKLEGVLIGCYINSIRTGAMGGVGTKYLARENAEVLGVMGTGLTARPLVEAICMIRDIKLARVYSPTQKNREQFCREMAQRIPSCEFRVCSRPDEAVVGADIVAVATSSQRPVVEADWIAPGTHITSVANGDLGRPRDELGPEVFRRAHRVVVTSKDTAVINESDVYRYARDGIIKWESVDDLCEVVAAIKPARTDEKEITIFKLPGMGMLDVALGMEFLKKCRSAGLGREV
jgi:ornithine cyclodeaminase/alanine dehydrogenase-like protein (mu-crystallin family)